MGYNESWGDERSAYVTLQRDYMYTNPIECKKDLLNGIK